MALQGFVESEYLSAKLAALQAAGSDWDGKTSDDLKTFLSDLGMSAEQHYEMYGYKEGLAPNNLFNPVEYKYAKALDMYNKGLTAEGGPTYADVAEAMAAFDAAWGDQDVYQHYLQYGSQEDINPSNSFDESSYLASKLAQLQANEPETWTSDKTVADVKAALAGAGYSALGHYLAYGKDESIAVTPVPDDEKVDATANPGQMFTLKAGTETIEGGAKDDTINGVSSALVADATLNPTDTIDGAGGNDTLALQMNSNFTGFTTGSVKNVETISLTNDTSIARSFDATGVTGATKYILNSAKTISLSDLDSTGLTIAMKGAQSNTTFAFATAVDVSGSADAMSLELNGVGAAKSSTAAQVNPSITMAGVEELNVKTTGAASYVDLSTVAALKTLTISGDQGLTVSDVNTALTSVEGSSATGDLDLILSVAGTGGTVTSVTTGSGADTVTIDAKDLQANATIAGGTGVDTLKLNDTAAAGSTLQLAQSGFETLEITGVATGQTMTYSASNVADLTTVQFDASATNDGAVSLVNMGSGDITVNVVGGAAAGQALTVDNSGLSTVNVEATAAQATAAVKSTGATTTNASTVTATNAGTAIFTVGQYMTQGGDFVANKASSVTLNVDSGKNSATTPAEITSFSGDLDAVRAGSVTVNADGKLASAEINAVAATSAVINTGKTASSADLILTKATDLQITSKGDFSALAAASDLGAVQSATLVTDGAMLIDTALTDAASLSISGTNAKSAFDNNAKSVGAATMDHSLVVTASGLKAGFSLDGTITSKQDVTIDSSAVTGNQAIGAAAAAIKGANVTLTSSGATGTVTYGIVEAATDGSGSATINAAGNTGNITIGTIGATDQHKTVSVDVSNSLGTVGIGVIKSDGSVTINAEDSLKAVTIGDGTANDSADVLAVSGFNLTAGLKAVALDVDIANVATTAFTGTLNGSIQADTIKLDLQNDAKSQVTLTGDMDLGTDAITIDASALATTNSATIDISGLKNYDVATITGGAVDDVIKGGADVDKIDGGVGADKIDLGADTAADVILIADAETASTSAKMDTIANFVMANDKIDLAATVIGTTASGSANFSVATDVTAAAGTTNGIATGMFTFDKAAATSLSDAITKVGADVATAGQAVIFEYGGNTYFFVDTDGAATTTKDVVIELTGVDSTSMAAASEVFTIS